MPRLSTALAQQKLDLRSKALAENKEELPQLEIPAGQLITMAAELKDLTSQQASLTASKQEVSKRLADLTQAARKLLTFVDTGVRQHYGNRAEKLVEFGLQPFRSGPRVRLIGLDGQPVKRRRKAAQTEEASAPPAEPTNTP